MRIAIFSDTFLPQVNGVVRSVVTTANGLAGRGHEVVIFTMDVKKVALCFPEHPDIDALDPRVKLCPLFSLALPRFKEIQARVPTFFHPYRLLKEFQPDVIHCHTIFSLAWEAMIVAKLLEIPFVGSHHGFLAEYLGNFNLNYDVAKEVVRRIIAFYYNRCDAVITPAQALCDELLAYGVECPVHVVSNPLDLDLFSSPGPKAELRNKCGITRPTFVHVGRLIPQKSVEVLLRGFALLREMNVDADLLVIGDGRDQTLLEDLARTLNIIGRVRFTGMLHGEELVQHVAACDVFVSASTTEVQALVFLEAMALGLPCIGVSAGGTKEYVYDRKNGLVVEPNNPEALAQAMRELILHPDQCETYGAHAQQSVMGFHSARILQEFERVYQSVRFIA
jgi:glycosyltransferase involved in cell wall biosynthesis